MPSKIRVGVIFGGRSGEHEVSLRSAESVINALDPDKYDVVPIAITKAGKWLASSEATDLLPGSVIEGADHRVAIFGDPTERGLAHFRQSGSGEDRSRSEGASLRVVTSRIRTRRKCTVGRTLVCGGL